MGTHQTIYMSEDNLKQQVKDAVKGIFSNPTVQRAVLNIVDNRRPQGWSSRSYPTYYKRVYAEQIRVDIEAMIKSHEEGENKMIIFDYDTWCGKIDSDGDRPLMKEKSLYLRVNQSIRFLIEHMDTDDHRYEKWNQCVLINQDRELKGVTIRWSPMFLEATGTAGEKMQARLVEPEVARPRWEREMDAYLEDGNDYEPFIKENLALTPDEVKELKARFLTLPNVMADINGSCIRLLKMKD